MLSKFIWRFVVGLCFAFPIGILAVVTVQAQTLEEQPTQNECEGCHEIIQTHWQESAHANSVTDQIFQQAWLTQGSPSECLSCHTTGYDPVSGTSQSENVACSVCHNPIPGEHPEEIMPTDISSRMCGTCHLDTHAEWEGSVHGQEDLACVRCHSPHTTELRADGVQDLCQSCHNEEAHFFTYTAHADEGLLCSDCHLRVSDSELGDGHGQRVHEFAVDLETCAQCHDEGMHYPVQGAMDGQGGSTLEPEPVLSMASAVPLQAEPDPVSPFGFAVLASLVGMGFGMVIAPWLEKWNRRIKEKRQNDEQ